ncbi:excisionase family DNA binding protein [Actinokineospora baliensis]|uniref:helix-turn-helix domain-containing protein n=1 Tax=Actinokineospora baliensis TaxID=547056 RepID=UPI00195EC439|nr:helix-turn-helix domain-containing protein [Actinokineospora baliensis]MBM7771988.1 excisionase family DNA binding protein [Actinokineospora baliensis]
MNVEEVADYLGIASKTVYQNWRTWGVPAVRIGGGDSGPLRFRREDIERVLLRWSIESDATAA